MRCDISSAHLGFFLCRTSVVAARVVIMQDIANVELLGVRKIGTVIFKPISA